MISPAAIAATDPSRSPSTCRNAARVLTFSRSRESVQATTRLTASPMAAMPNTSEPLHGNRSVDAVECFEEDPRDHRQHRERIHEGGNDLDACQSEGMPIGDGPTRDDIGGEREQQRCRVGGHVTRIGQQRKRSGPQAARHFDQRVTERQRYRDGEGTCASSTRMVPVDTVAVVVLAEMRVTVVPAADRRVVVRRTATCAVRMARRAHGLRPRR